jgi:cell division protein FtsW (lipid II flippase)
MRSLFTLVFLTTFAVVMFCAGLWWHDWRVIFAGALIAVIWPLIHKEVTEEERWQR